MKTPPRSIRTLIFGALALGVIAAPAALAADVTDIGFVDQGQLAGLPAFVRANGQMQSYAAALQKQYIGRARNASQQEQQRLGQEFQGKMADEQRRVLGPLIGKAQVAIASVASSKNLSVVLDKRIIIVGGQDITNDVRDLLSGSGDPVPPVSTPPPSTVGFVDQTKIDAVPAIHDATSDFAKFKADQDRTTAQKLRGVHNDADRNAVLKDYQKSLEDKQNAELKPLADKTKSAISDVAHKKNLALVIDRANVIFGGQDITSDVTAELGK